MIKRPILRALRHPTSSLTRSGPTFVSSSKSRVSSQKTPVPAQARIPSRWYSTAEETKSSEAAINSNNPTTGEDSTRVDKPGENKAEEQDPLKKELEASKKEIVELKDKYLRQVAEYRNLQERTRREIQAAKDFAISKFGRDLIESIDTFDLALSTVPAEKLAPATSESEEDSNKELRQLHDGLRMTESVLLSTLKKHGLERFDPSEDGEKFDPNRHEAMFQTPQPDKTDGTVFHTTQKGFMLNGRVLRAAKVGVVKNS